MAREIGHRADTHKDSNNKIYNTYPNPSNKTQEVLPTSHRAQQLQQKQTALSRIQILDL